MVVVVIRERLFRFAEIVLEARDIIAKNGYTFGRSTTATATSFRL
jgi:hypothetical protein